VRRPLPRARPRSRRRSCGRVDGDRRVHPARPPAPRAHLDVKHAADVNNFAEVKETLADDLDHARRRSLALLEPLSEPALVAQHSPLMSPLIWDLAHVGNYEDLWLVRALGAE